MEIVGQSIFWMRQEWDGSLFPHQLFVCQHALEVPPQGRCIVVQEASSHSDSWCKPVSSSRVN